MTTGSSSLVRAAISGAVFKLLSCDDRDGVRVAAMKKNGTVRKADGSKVDGWLVTIEAERDALGRLIDDAESMRFARHVVKHDTVFVYNVDDRRALGRACDIMRAVFDRDALLESDATAHAADRVVAGIENDDIDDDVDRGALPGEPGAAPGLDDEELDDVDTMASAEEMHAAHVAALGYSTPFVYDDPAEGPAIDDGRDSRDPYSVVVALTPEPDAVRRARELWEEREARFAAARVADPHARNLAALRAVTTRAKTLYDLAVVEARHTA